jgi:7,8-dihydropterin-6-yl-methyl-4-(beta-D-ribofuranosyl)aminobenzene 5'-phosphate synthase
MEVKITGVYDEGAIESTSLIGAEGFSVLIEAGGKKILFDTGRRGRYLLHNMSFLDLKPAEIDKVVISHGHKAHFGGLNALLSEREEPLHVYIPRSAFGTKRSVPESMKLQDDQIEKADIIEISGWMEVADKVFISTPLEIGDGETEAFMVVLSRKGPIVISACSHAGVGKVMESVKDRFGTYPTDTSAVCT